MQIQKKTSEISSSRFVRYSVRHIRPVKQTNLLELQEKVVGQRIVMALTRTLNAGIAIIMDY
jgi:hypothetical protein